MKMFPHKGAENVVMFLGGILLFAGWLGGGLFLPGVWSGICIAMPIILLFTGFIVFIFYMLWTDGKRETEEERNAVRR